MTPDPKRARTNDPELEAEEMENDSLGEETPSDATGLEDDDEDIEAADGKRPA